MPAITVTVYKGYAITPIVVGATHLGWAVVRPSGALVAAARSLAAAKRHANYDLK